MKKSELDRILREELGHISQTGRWQRVFRMAYNMVRRRDLGESPLTPRRRSFLKTVQDFRLPGFDPGDLVYHVGFFGPVPVDATKPVDPAARERATKVGEREKVLAAWEAFAGCNNLRLAYSSNDLVWRAGNVVDHKGGCCCLPEKRPRCPCSEAIVECQEKGACFCGVLVSH
ncbi:MAG: hypothetical protein HY673_24810 [Chloroflexi bacterium]|nr:hypothetical protein [Chloroflexota bacterium]